MKFKKITQKALPVIFSIVLAVSTSITGVGATDGKTYLKDLDYPTVETNLKPEKYGNYSFTEYDGTFVTHGVNGTVECSNAMKLGHNIYRDDYEDGSNCVSYTFTYNLNREFKEFHTELFTDSGDKIDCEILGDNNRLAMKSITEESELVNLSLNVNGIDKLSINIKAGFGYYTDYPETVFNNAYLTTDTVNPIPQPTEPTEPTNKPNTDPTQPTNEPNTDPTQPTVEPNTDPTQPTNEPNIVPTRPIDDPTQPTNEPNIVPTQPTDEPTEEPTSKPTQAPTNTPTDKPNVTPINNNTNNTTGKTAGAVNTGDTGFIFVAIMVLGTAGSATFIVRKVKHSK